MKELLEILHDVFYTPPEFEELNTEIDSCCQQLREILDKPNRRLLMQIIDDTDHIRNEVSVDSFIYGFRLALRLAQELAHCEESNPLPIAQDPEDNVLHRHS